MTRYASVTAAVPVPLCRDRAAPPAGRGLLGPLATVPRLGADRARSWSAPTVA
jgi:hypothetical protein